MLNSGPYSEQGEMRLRAREAVLEGLSESYFVPVDGEHIGYVTAKVPSSPTTGPPLTSAPSPTPSPPSADNPTSDDSSNPVLIAWEECAGENKASWKNALVLWLPAAGFDSTPLQKLSWLIGQLRNSSSTEVKVIGPPTSNGLQAMLREAKSSATVGELASLKGVTILAAKPTAPADELGLTDEKELTHVLEKWGQPPTPSGLRFIRTITPDNILCNALIQELKLRQVNISAPSENRQKNDHVIILSEWDSKYGRSWANIFSRSANVDVYHYLHGIDGRLPGDVVKQSDPDDKAKAATAASATIEETEGQNQSDFLRRLARELRNKDTRWRREDGHPRIRAIGLLGTDVFDKLMILRAMRPEFPDAIFFTNNYDAHLELRSVWGDAHNLVVASPFGSVLPKYQHDLAPFRDSDQTSMFAATLVATKQVPEDELNDLIKTPYLFEIGRDGAVQLAIHQGDRGEVLPTGPELDWFTKWLDRSGTLWSLALTAIFLVLLAVWVARLVIRRQRRENLPRRVIRLLSDEALLLIGIPLIVLAVCGLAQAPIANAEPLAFFSGISIWPSEMLRLIALLLALHFMLRASVAMHDNQGEINKVFGFQEIERKGGAQGFILGLSGLRRRHRDWFEPGAKFPVEKMWGAYLRFNSFVPRFVRVAIYFVIYLFFCLSLVALFCPPIVPSRGPFASAFDFKVIVASGITLMILTFYVVDAIQLNRNFILVFSDGISAWPPKSFEHGRRPPLSEEQLFPYQNVLLIAKRTEVVARLIWYPIIVITLMFVARLSIFDNWTWPPMLVLMFGLNGSWAIGSAVLLRRAAERLRTVALESLQRFRSESYVDETKRRILTELIEEIRDLKKGAFAPLSEQPFVRAILVPSGSVGLLAIFQRVFDLF